MIRANRIKQKALYHPNQKLCNQEGGQIVPKEKVQQDPEQELGNEVARDTGEENGFDRFLCPQGISNNNHTFDDNGN